METNGPVAITPEGWITISPRLFPLLAAHPPRPIGYLTVLREDVRDWRFVAIWLAGIAMTALGVAAQLWIVAVLGGFFLVRMVFLFRSAYLSFRNAPALVGTLMTLDRSGRLLNGVIPGQARLTDGREMRVGLPVQLVSAISARQGSADLMFLHMAAQVYSLVIGVRATPKREPPASGGALPANTGPKEQAPETRDDR